MKESALIQSEPIPDRTMIDLWRQFYPLAISDFTMALGDTVRTIFLGRFLNPEITFAVIGVIKSIAICLESPIITILHISTVLSAQKKSHHALGRFTLLLSGLITLIFLALCCDPLFSWLITDVFSVPLAIKNASHMALLLMVPWPAAIACRRFYQGILIRNRREKTMSLAAIMRLLFTTAVLTIGLYGKLDALLVGTISLIGAVLVETAVVVFYARKEIIPSLPVNAQKPLPTTLLDISKFYLPLGLTSTIIWLSRALLLAIIAHAHDGLLAVAVWTVASGFFLPLANATRMLQQMVITASQAGMGQLLRFSLLMGLLACLPLLPLSFSGAGSSTLTLLVGSDDTLIASLIPCLQVLFFLPLLVAIQNYLQGRLILLSAHWWINIATMVNSVSMLTLGALFVFLDFSGALAAALATAASLLIEVSILKSRV